MQGQLEGAAGKKAATPTGGWGQLTKAGGCWGRAGAEAAAPLDDGLLVPVSVRCAERVRCECSTLRLGCRVQTGWIRDSAVVVLSRLVPSSCRSCSS